MPNATLTAAEGVGEVVLTQRGLSNIPRSLYLYENKGIEALPADASNGLARVLFLYENKGVEVLAVLARSLYLYENRGIEALVALARALYAYEATRDSEVFPWLEKIVPNEAVRGQQVALYGDGLGEIVDVAAGSTVTTSSVNGGNIGTNAVDRLAAEWVSNDGALAWIRFTFGAARVVTAIALEDRELAGQDWGIPEFRFSDGGANVAGAGAVPKAIAATAEYPVGGIRGLYVLPAPRTTTYVEVRVSSGGAGANRGLREAWVYADLDQAAETSTVHLNDGLPAAELLGIASWSNRSPGLWPANGGLPTQAAALVTVGPASVSGLVKVREST